jgi:hypothetical protein
MGIKLKMQDELSKNKGVWCLVDDVKRNKGVSEDRAWEKKGK